MFSLISAWINGWVNNRKAGDLRRYRAHYGVIVIEITFSDWRPFLYPHTTKLLGGEGILVSPRPSICPSVRPSSRVRSVASTVQDGFFSYLVQMINSMRGCVACDDPWPWPTSSRSFGLNLENRIRPVASTVLDGLFLYLAQMITIITGCVACYVFFSAIFLFFFGLDLEKNLQFSMDSFHI